MSRYTDIDLLLNKYQTICCGVACMDCPFNDEGCRLEKMLLESPIVDAVEVVRCKDCKYAEQEDYDYLCHHNGCDWNSGEHYCSYGEKVTG